MQTYITRPQKSVCLLSLDRSDLEEARPVAHSSLTAMYK